MTTGGDSSQEGLCFGPFSLFASRRLLEKDGVPVDLGARALDILIALTSSPNEVLAKKDLINRVWQGVVIEEGSLRFQMTRLRQALEDGKDGARYITTISGRGYCFVAPFRAGERPRPEQKAAVDFPHANLPSRPGRMIDRLEDVATLSAQLETSRIVSIVGAGGVGKTTVALAVGNNVSDQFYGSVLIADFGMLSDPALVSAALASMLGLAVGSNDVVPSITSYLRKRRVLLILDTCEHLIDAVADLASRIVEAAPRVHILTTSREPLRIAGERVYKLEPLAFPPENIEPTAGTVRSYPAAELFIERAAESGVRMTVDDSDAGVIADICRRLGGVALALELAARRVETVGLQQTAALLNQHLTLGWQGSRTAPPRQRTLQATLDWSFGLLSASERMVLASLSVFVGHFTLDAALAVVATTTLDRSTVFSALDNLVAKSIIVTQPIGSMMRYRLLDTTRSYALEADAGTVSRSELSRRHADYYRRWMEQFGPEWQTFTTGAERLPHFVALNNARSALEWCFGQEGDIETGIKLAAATVPVFLTMSLLPECHRWSQEALSRMDEGLHGGIEEMRLRLGLGISAMYMHGGREAARSALERSLEIAEMHGEPVDQLRILGPLNVFHLRGGEFKAALSQAQKYSDVSARLEDGAVAVSAHSVLGTSLHLTGDLTGARTELEAALAIPALSHRNRASYLGLEGRNLAGAFLARTLWLQGSPAKALELARQTVQDATDQNHSLTLCTSLLGSLIVSLWCGDVSAAEEQMGRLINRAETNSLAPFVFLARGFGGEMAIRRGEAETGVEVLKGCLERLHAVTYEVCTVALEIALAEGLAVIGRHDEGTALLDRSISRSEASGDLCYMPEVYRIRARLAIKQEHSSSSARYWLERSWKAGRIQGAKAWQLRTATDLAALSVEEGKSRTAVSVLQPIFESFDEGWETADLRTAGRLLMQLRAEQLR